MPSLYQPIPGRLKLFSLPPPTIGVISDSSYAIETLTDQRAGPSSPAESLARLSSDGSAPVEMLAMASVGAPGDMPLPIDAGATVCADRTETIEALSLMQGIAPNSVEWSGALQTVADAGAPLEGAAAMAGGLSAFNETLSLLPPSMAGRVEWLATAGSEAEATAETLGATGAAISGDLMLPLEWRQGPPATVPSLESGPGRVRLLASAGRVRLLGRS
jgi:hypothetical protein